MNLAAVVVFSCAVVFSSCRQYDVATDFLESTHAKTFSKSTVNAMTSKRPGTKTAVAFGAGGYASRVDTFRIASNEPAARKLIRNASLRFEVEDYVQTRKRIGDIVHLTKAYISSERESRTEYQISNTMKIRVVASKFGMIVDSLIGQAKSLDEKRITVEDVTEEFIDVQARLKAQRDVEGRYLEILKKAGTVEDILAVEQKLGEIREKIESKEGRLQYLTHQVSYSTVNVGFYENQEVTPKTRPGYFKRLAVSFLGGWTGLTEFILGIVALWPFLLIMTGAGYLVFRLIVKLRKNPTAPELSDQ